MFLTYIDWQAKLVAILALTLMMLFTKSVDANDRVFIDEPLRHEWAVAETSS